MEQHFLQFVTLPDTNFLGWLGNKAMCGDLGHRLSDSMHGAKSSHAWPQQTPNDGWVWNAPHAGMSHRKGRGS